ncbi:hypothetical protein C1M53_26705 [Mesorhizobium sp. Pch-S]|nr:hypothetical protein C1M53_26705 [Mesorhizobium sp. Pch-S]
MKATVDPETRTFTLLADGKGSRWIGQYPIADYEKWVRFYAEQQERYAPHAQSYQPAVDALASIADQIRLLRGC